jgi:TRAP-type C4-dicarboxylate transport system substrate-binding protein
MSTFSKKIGAISALAAGLVALSAASQAASVKGNNISLRIGSGHPPFVTYVKSASKYFVPNVKRRVAAETKYKIKFKEHYAGTVVNVFDTLEGTQDGRLDIGAWCVCFDDDKAMALNLGYFVPFGEPNAIKAGVVFAQVVKDHPAIAQDLEKRYKQKLLAVSGFNNYGILSSFDWKKFEDLKGRKILAAGPNLPWVAAGIPVRTTIPKAAQQMQTGVGEAIILFPDTDYKLKLHEAIKGGYYTITDFGAVTQVALTMNLKARKKLPAEVVKIIDEEAKKYHTQSLTASQNDHAWGLKKLKEAGTKIRTIDPAAKKAWAQKLKPWVNSRAQAVTKKKKIDMGKIMRAYIAGTKAAGHTYPVDYVIN